MDLVNLLRFARKYYYTKTEEYNSIGYYLTDIVYSNGEVKFNSQDGTVNIVKQDVDVVLNTNTISLNFNYLPSEQVVEIQVNGNSFTDYTRGTDSIVLNVLWNTVNTLNIRLTRYDDNEGITYQGLEETFKYKSLFSKSAYITSSTNIFNNTYYTLIDPSADKMPYSWNLTLSNNVEIGNMSLSSNRLEMTFRFSDSTLVSYGTPVSFTIYYTDDEFIYHPVRCDYNNGEYTLTEIIS